MAKQKKAMERNRQAKAMRQRARARDRRRVQPSERPPDDLQMFRDDLIPDDVPASVWNRLQITHDLDGRTPTQALAEFLDLFVDIERLGKGDRETRTHMEWGLFFWRVALMEPQERVEILGKAAAELPAPPEGEISFEEFARSIVAAHEEMFPRLHEHIARIRAARGVSGVKGARETPHDGEPEDEDESEPTWRSRRRRCSSERSRRMPACWSSRRPETTRGAGRRWTWRCSSGTWAARRSTSAPPYWPSDGSHCRPRSAPNSTRRRG
jgi:hypothetical protein